MRGKVNATNSHIIFIALIKTLSEFIQPKDITDEFFTTVIFVILAGGHRDVFQVEFQEGKYLNQSCLMCFSPQKDIKFK